MNIIATIPPPQRDEQVRLVAEHPLLSGARFNVGARSPYPPAETLERLRDALGEKTFWVDLKGRQLRITGWAVPTYGDIELNHEFEVDLPATIYFRGAEKSLIREVRGKKIYVDPPPPRAVGDGQAVNVHGKNLRIKGFLTEEDRLYIEAARNLGIHDYMLSFVEEQSDIAAVRELDPAARIVAKIESPRGLEFVRGLPRRSGTTLASGAGGAGSTSGAGGTSGASAASSITLASGAGSTNAAGAAGSAGVAGSASGTSGAGGAGGTSGTSGASGASEIRLMAARDDLFINLEDSKLEMFDALELILEKDPDAMVASRILTSLENEPLVSMGDLSDLHLMDRLGYRTFMLSDGLCARQGAFLAAMSVLGEYRRKFKRSE